MAKTVEEFMNETLIGAYNKLLEAGDFEGKGKEQKKILLAAETGWSIPTVVKYLKANNLEL